MITPREITAASQPPTVLKLLFPLLQSRVAPFQFEIIRLFALLLFERKFLGAFPFHALDPLSGGFTAEQFFPGHAFRAAFRPLFPHFRGMLLPLRLHLQFLFHALGALFFFFGFARRLRFRLFRLAGLFGKRGVHALFGGGFFLAFPVLLPGLAYGGFFFRFLFGCLAYLLRLFPGAFCDIFYFFRSRRDIFGDIVFFLFHAFTPLSCR